jgi:hypothetical protein
MLGYLERVAEHLGFVRVGGLRADLERTRAMLNSEDGERVMLEFQLGYQRRRDALAQAKTNSGFQRILDQLLIEAADKVARDNEDARAYAKAAADRTEAEKEFIHASGRLTGRRWQAADDAPPASDGRTD